MPKYRRIPTVIEAHQFTDVLNPPRGVLWNSGIGFHVVTIHGQPTPVVIDDWIMPEPDGEHFYPCKPDIFATTYEEVVE